GCNTADRPQKELVTDMDRASYAIGFDIGNSLKQQGVTDLDLDIIYQGMADATGGMDTLMTQEEMMTALNNFQQEMMRRQQERSEVQGAENQAAGEAFLAENATREGVQTTESGLQYKVITEGDGARPSATDLVTVHYR